jgi:hypothetical protein
MKEDVHEQALSGFGRAAATCERGRPDHPAGATGWLCEQLGLEG